MMRLSFPLSSFLSLTLLTCLSANQTQYDLSAIPKQGRDISSAPSSSKPTAPAQQKAKFSDLILVDVGAVYLRPYQGGSDFAQIVPISALNEPIYGKNIPLDFDFAWGFRGDLGYQCQHSQHTLHANYLYFQASAHQSVQVDPTTQAIASNILNLINKLPFSDASSSWKLHFNMLDIVFGKKTTKISCMSFEPYIGAKGLLFRETQTANYSFLNMDMDIKQRVHFQGIGPTGGINLDWRITKWLSITGGFDVAFLYSSVKTTRSCPQQNAFVWTGSSHDIKATPMLDAMLALRGVYCQKNGRFIDLRIGFEEHYVFEIVKHTFAASDTNNDLSLQGWFATLGFGF